MNDEAKLFEILKQAHAIVLVADNVIQGLDAGYYSVQLVDFDEYKVYTYDDYGDDYEIDFDSINLEDEKIIVYGLTRLNNTTPENDG